MSTVDEIANAIKNLSAAERAQLVESIPALLPELDGDAEWSRIINDPTPWPKLEKFLDEIDAQYRKDPEQFPVVRENDFDEKS